MEHGISPFDSQTAKAWSTPRSSSPPRRLSEMESEIGVARTHDRRSESTELEDRKAIGEGAVLPRSGFGAHSRAPSSSYGGGWKDSVLEGSRSPLADGSSVRGGAGTLDDGIDNDTRRWNALLNGFASRHPRLGRAVLWIRGPSPPVNEKAIKPFLPKIEAFFAHHLHPVTSRRRIITPLFLLAWLFAFIFFVRASFYDSHTNVGTPTFIVADTSYWYRDDQCGINGTSCMPFSDYSFVFRCPGQTLSVELLNNRAVGDDELIFQPLVVGGGDELSTYRADSWICASAIHHGLFGDKRGGCGQLELVGEFTGYVGGKRHGIDSVSFDSTFPSSYRFTESVDQGGCQDLRDDILGFNVGMTTLFSFIIR